MSFSRIKPSMARCDETFKDKHLFLPISDGIEAIYKENSGTYIYDSDGLTLMKEI